MTIEIRPAVSAELENVATLLASSLGTVEPTLTWYFPGVDDPGAATLPLARLWVNDSYEEGSLRVAVRIKESSSSDELCGVAVWYQEIPPARFSWIKIKDTWQRVHPIMGFNTWRYFYEGFTARHARGVGPHCYLGGLAVAPSCRGLGAARQLITSTPCNDIASTLECREELLPFYRHFGFQVESAYRLPGIATMYSLRKEADVSGS